MRGRRGVGVGVGVGLDVAGLDRGASEGAPLVIRHHKEVVRTLALVPVRPRRLLGVGVALGLGVGLGLGWLGLVGVGWGWG